MAEHLCDKSMNECHTSILYKACNCQPVLLGIGNLCACRVSVYIDEFDLVRVFAETFAQGVYNVGLSTVQKHPQGTFFV